MHVFLEISMFHFHEFQKLMLEAKIFKHSNLKCHLIYYESNLIDHVGDSRARAFASIEALKGTGSQALVGVGDGKRGMGRNKSNWEIRRQRNSSHFFVTENRFRFEEGVGYFLLLVALIFHHPNHSKFINLWKWTMNRSIGILSPTSYCVFLIKQT